MIQSVDSLTVQPLGVPAEAGPWRITVGEVVAGAEANALLVQTNPENPAAPDGLSYIATLVTVENRSDRPLSIAQADFAVSGGDGILRRSPGAVLPDPPLHAVVAPGASSEGWVVSTVNDPAAALLWYDSATIASGWGDAVFALAEGATLPAVEAIEGADTDVGADPARPAAIGDTVRTGGWEVTVQDVIYGQEVFDLADFRLRALGSGYGGIGGFIGINVAVRNVSPFAAYFATSALEIADPMGEPWDHTTTLTPPNPDVSREYLPGASGEGWVAFEPQRFATAELIRILPSHVGGSPRYVAFVGGGADAPAQDVVATPAPVAVDPGTAVVTTEDRVNLRSGPSASAEIVIELPIDTALTVTGEPVEADGYTWYPVDVTEGEESGFVAANFIRAAP
jgi:hypothetical protein